MGRFQRQKCSKLPVVYQRNTWILQRLVLGAHEAATFTVAFILDGFQGRDRAVLVNTGTISGRQLSHAEKMVTIAHEAGHYVLHYGNKETKQLFFRFSKGPSFCREEEVEPAPFNLKEEQRLYFHLLADVTQGPVLNAWSWMARGQHRLANQFDVTESLVRLRAQMFGL